MNTRDDISELIDRARCGAADALGKPFEAARSKLLDLADRELPADLRMKISPSDLVQETAIEMQRDFGHFTGTTAAEYYAWLREMLQHNAIDSIRRYHDVQKRDVKLDRSLTVVRAEEIHGHEGPFHLPDGSAIRREEAAAISAMVQRLPPDYRRVLELRYWGGLSFVAIGSELGRSPDTARKLWYRALQRLQHELALSSFRE